MAHVVTFRSSRFDVRAEDPNPINPIAGQSVLVWLRAELVKAGYAATEPATEDWGWYIDVRRDGTSYLVGASADAESSAPEVEWTVQVHRHRSLGDRITGRGKMDAGDPLAALIGGIVRADPRCSEVSFDWDGRP